MRVPGVPRWCGGHHPVGDTKSGPIRLTFNPQLRVEFRGATVTSDAGLLLPRELDERLGLDALIERHLTDPRTGHNRQFPLNRALMVVWVAHFVARMHRMFGLQLQGAQPEPVVVDWFFYHDKFAGDSPDASPAMSFFQTLVSGNISNGNVRSGFFVESDTVQADLLA